MTSIIIACVAMAATGGFVTMIHQIKPTRDARRESIEQQFEARAAKDIAAKAASEILDAAGDGECDTEDPANPQ